MAQSKNETKSYNKAENTSQLEKLSLIKKKI